jgi:hypothetical protein
MGKEDNEKLNYLLKRNCIKFVVGLNIHLESPTLCMRRQGFKFEVKSFFYFRKKG